MRIGILGSGLMGGKLGTIFARVGHDVVFSYARRRVPLDKGEGVVKAQVCCSVLGAPRFSPERLRTELWNFHGESLLGETVPPAIDTAYTSAMILLSESRLKPGRERPINTSV